MIIKVKTEDIYKLANDVRCCIGREIIDTGLYVSLAEVLDLVDGISNIPSEDVGWSFSSTGLPEVYIISENAIEILPEPVENYMYLF